MTKIWTWLKNNFGTITNVAIVVIGIVIIWLDMTGRAGPEAIREATLALLSLIGASLLVNHIAYNRLRQWIEDIMKQPPKPSTSQILEPYRRFWDQIEEKLGQAKKEVWVLSRSCAGLWWDFNEQFTQLLSYDHGVVRLMLVDPDGAAVQMIADSAEGIDNADLYGAQIRGFLAKLEDLRPGFRGSLEVRIIDHLPAWTLVLIDPQGDRGMIFIELATFRARPNKRPTFQLTTEADKEWFERFGEDFETMWSCAQEVDLSPDGH